MGVYKVPQNVEAEDKLLGPLTFRQFIYLMIAAGLGVLGYFLYQLSPFLVVIPTPLFLLFGVLALPLRKDQPMEVYLLAVIQFYLKPHLRLWSPDGSPQLVEIAAAQVSADPLRSPLTREAAEERLEYLSRIMDSRGWSIKQSTAVNDQLAPEVINDAANATDVLDDRARLAKSFDELLNKKSQQQRQTAIASMRQAVTQAAPPSPSQPATPPPAKEKEPSVRFNPYPAMHQRVIMPYDANRQKPAERPKPAQPQPAPPTNSPMAAAIPPGIMRLAHNNNLTISAIAREAQRIQQEEEGGEVIVSLH